MLRQSTFFFLLCFLTACSPPPSAPPATATAPAGPRIVSTVPAATLNLVLIGASQRIVGVTKYDSLYLPDDKKNLPVVGDYETMDYERLLALQPTALIIQTADWKIPARLKELAATHHFEIVNIQMDTIDDLWKTIARLGKAAEMETEAQEAIDRAKADLAALARELEGKPKVRALYAMGRNPMMVAGSNNYVDEMLTLAGAENLGRAAGKWFPVISPETLIQLAPDVLLVTAPGEPLQQVNDPRIDPWLRFATPAARNNKIRLVTSATGEMLGADIARNIRELSELLHDAPPKP